jgi:hypothetical protein
MTLTGEGTPVVNTRKIASLAVAGLAAAAIAAAGCASAATSASAAAATAPAVKTIKGATHIMAYSINSDGPYFHAIVTGAVGDYGPGVTVHPDGTVDPGHTSQLELKLAHGSFRLSIAAADKAVVRAYQHWPSNPATCSGGITVSAPAPVVAGSGTGRYRGITGDFTLTVKIDEVDVKPVCNGTSKFLSQLILLDGTGTVSY